MRSFNIFIFSILFCCNVYGYSREWALKGGVGLANNLVDSLFDKDDYFLGAGFNTQYGYRYNKWEFNFTSYIFLGSIDTIRVNANSSEIEGKGFYRRASFGPIAKYITDWKYKKNWRYYFFGGPIWSLQTVKFDEFQVISGTFKKDYKLTYKSKGFVIGLGIEEQLPYKEMHAVFIEILYTYLKAYKISVVDATDFAEVETLSTERTGQRILDQVIMINMGLTIF